jgi:hypothetical protein
VRRVGLLCAVVLLVSACGSDDDSASTGTTSSTTTTTVSTTTTTASTSIELGAPVALGDGVLVGVHPTAPIAYVSVVDRETDEVGCEGGDVARLWAQPLDGGGPVRALADSFLSGLVLDGGADGTVAVVDSCEGFLSSLTVARPAADGTFADVVTVDTTAAEGSGQLMPNTIRWARDGRSFVALVHDVQGESIRAVRIGLDGTLTTIVQADELLAVAELADGRIVTATADAVRIDDDAPVAVKVTSLEVDPQRRRIVVFGEDGASLLDGGVAPATTDTDPATVGSWSPSGDALAYLRLEGDDAAVVVAALDGAPLLVDDTGGFGAPRFSADGRFVLYNDAIDSGQGYAEPRATARPLSSS